jgi:phenylacetate-CoA ligase
MSLYSNAAYKSAPAYMQSALISLSACGRRLLREGRRFKKLEAEACATELLSLDELDAWQRQRLAQLITHATERVPFYKGRVPGSRPIRDPLMMLQSFFPIISKETVRQDPAAFLDDRRSRVLFWGSTSGTTGSPLSLVQDLYAINRENAFAARQLRWAGFAQGEKRVWFRGDLVVPSTTSDPPFWRWNWTERTLMCSSYHLSFDTAAAYLEVIERFDPVLIQAYPSSIAFLARWLLDRGGTYQGKALKGIVTSSEMLDAETKLTLEKVFGCRVFDWYGQFERVAAIGTCEEGRRHLLGDYSFVELVPVGDGYAEIVGTGFNNWVMPLIRYRTGDLVRLMDDDTPCPCGRAFPVVGNILGRADDVIVTPDGRRVGRLDHIFKGAGAVLEAQIRQDSLDELLILVVPAAHFKSTDADLLVRNARERLGLGIQIRVQTVQAIPRTRNGKLRGVISNVQ